jgi:hypothetical protein
MKLTAFQKRCLESYVYLRGKRPTLMQVLGFRAQGWLPVLGIVVISTLVFCVNPLWGMFMIGLVLGAVFRIIGTGRFTVMAWPLIEQVLDWDRVESLLREDTQPSAGGNAASPRASA